MPEGTAPTNTAPTQSDAQPENAGSGVVSATAPKPAEQGAPPQTNQQKQEARRLKLKVDGRDEELSEDEVVKWAQMGRSAQKRFQEAAMTRRQAEDFIRMLKENPAAVLTNPAIGIDLRKFSEEYLAKELKKETLSPEQKRIQELEDELKKHDEDRKKGEKQRQDEEFNRVKQHYIGDLDRKISDALNGSGLPKSPKTVQRTVQYMLTALENGVDLDPSDVVRLVRQDYISEINDLFSQTDGDALLKILGDGVANKIRKADLARIKTTIAAPPSMQQQATTKKEEPEAKVKQPKNIYDWRKEVDRRVNS